MQMSSEVDRPRLGAFGGRRRPGAGWRWDGAGRREGCVADMCFFSSRRRHTRFDCDWSSDVCSSDLAMFGTPDEIAKKLDTLRAACIEHVLLNGGGGPVANLRRFAHEVMPAFGADKRAADRKSVV